MTRRLVVGVGNRSRGDDAVGLAVADALRSRPLDVTVVESDGEPARLLDLWDGADVAVVVDAVRTGCDPGTVLRVDVDLYDGDANDGERLALGRDVGAVTSSHGLGVDAAVALGRALGRLPLELAIVGVEARSFETGAAMTRDVAAAVDEAANVVVAIVEGTA